MAELTQKELRARLASGDPGRLFFLYGEESYLKEYYKQQFTALTGSGPMAAFNLTELEGATLSAKALSDALEPLPFGAEKRIVIVRDLNVFRMASHQGDLKAALPSILEDLPDHVCLVFYYQFTEFSPDKRTSLYKLISKVGDTVNFTHPTDSELCEWIARRFRAAGKRISRDTCMFFISHAGRSMTALIGDIDKISVAAGAEVTEADIREYATPTVEARIFDLSDRVAARDAAGAMKVIADLFETRSEPIVILGALATGLRQLYCAALISKSGKGQRDLTSLLGLRSPSQASRIMQQASRFSLRALRDMQLWCAQADTDLKGANLDGRTVLELLVLRMTAA